ncbi:hypothetical protein J5N97_017945 [Dioscorea zingiberensis]|uniref:Zinc beta-ribbon domain-containing protein n=1 Tax=Dioscorea zingiberensis TaxID=325984 RepID=A0A9D5CMI3_9LILI|nr:hypothetical protein J5N97_017945 [Dioscorea zingiberensis]
MDASPGHRAEAVRNLAIAERLLAARDLVGSKRFAELALEHDPLLDGIDQVLAIADVLLAAQTHPGDPFAVLGLDRSAAATDPSGPSRNFRRLALLLRADRNPLPSAAQALKALSDAFSAVSNDRSTPNNASPFWTACPACCHVHQYGREYLDRNLRCPSCGRAFPAKALREPPPIVPGTDSYFCSWAFFPIGFPSSPIDPNWKPFIPFFPTNPDSNTPTAPNPNPSSRGAAYSEKNGDAKGAASTGRSKKVARKKVGANMMKKVLTSEAMKATTGININEAARMGPEEKSMIGDDVEFHIDLDSTEELLGNLQNLPFLKEDDFSIRMPSE